VCYHTLDMQLVPVQVQESPRWHQRVSCLALIHQGWLAERGRAASRSPVGLVNGQGDWLGNIGCAHSAAGAADRAQVLDFGGPASRFSSCLACSSHPPTTAKQLGGVAWSARAQHCSRRPHPTGEAAPFSAQEGDWTLRAAARHFDLLTRATRRRGNRHVLCRLMCVGCVV